MKHQRCAAEQQLEQNRNQNVMNVAFVEKTYRFYVDRHRYNLSSL
jgi:hypothetical protein